MDSVGAAGTAHAEEDPEAAVREYARGIPTSASASASATSTIGSGTVSSFYLTALTSGGVYQLLYPSNSNLPSEVEADRAVVLGDSDPVDS